MLVNSSRTVPPLGLGHHDVAATVVPLLSGAWFYRSRCHCGDTADGQARTLSHARRLATNRLRCHAHTARVTYRRPLLDDEATAAAGKHPVVHRPHARLIPRGERRPSDLAVTAHRATTGAWGLAAVTGAGWVALDHLAAPRLDPLQAHVAAVILGLSMLPPGLDSTLVCDQRTVLDMLDLMRRHMATRPADTTCRVRDALRLPQPVFDRLHVLLADKNVHPEHQDRNVGQMITATTCARRRSRAGTEDAALADFARVQWRRDPASIGANRLHHEAYPYCEVRDNGENGRYLGLDLPGLPEGDDTTG